MLGERSLKKIQRDIDSVDGSHFGWCAFAVILAVVCLSLLALAAMDYQNNTNVTYWKTTFPRAIAAFVGSMLCLLAVIFVLCGPAATLKQRLRQLKEEKRYTAGLGNGRGKGEAWVSDRQNDERPRSKKPQ
jgi:uncharacterized integral membrane protein